MKKRKLKKFLAAALACALAGSMLPVSAVPAKAAPERVNFALDKPVTASHNDGNGPERAVDGSLDTRWGTDPRGSDQWLCVDLEKVTEFDELYIASEASDAQKMRKYKVEGSLDGSQYEMIYDAADQPGGYDLEQTIKLEEKENYRYVKITVERLIDGAYPSVSLREFQVIGDEAPDVTSVKKALEELVVPEKVYHSFRVPLSNEDGVSFAWESLSSLVTIGEDGTVSIADVADTEEAAVKVTASKGEYSQEKEFSFQVYADTAADYNIYPVPQSMTYGEGILIPDETIHVTIPDTVDDVVRNYAERVLADYQFEYDFGETDGTKLLLGTAGDGSAADTYFADVDYDRETSVDIDEGYVLAVDAEQNTIAVLGHDSSGIFNGLSTLRWMLESSRAQLKEAVITDAPDTLYRGIVEGFYGEYSFEERMDLIEFIGPLKMNTYIYGSKSDPYHNGQWREPYPQDKISQIAQLVECGKENNVELVWTAHVGGHIDMGSQADYDALTAKFDQLYDVGVRQFGLFYDDAGTDNTYLTEFINKLNQEYIHKKEGVKSLIVCPQAYNKNQADDNYFAKLAAFDEDVQIMWTGDAVISEVSPSMMEYIESKIHRPAYIWWNYPVNDLGLGAQLLVGETVGLSTEMGHMNGLVSNPMLQAQASKFSLFSIADYSWNIADFDRHASWENGVDYIIEGNDYAEAFKTFSANNNQSVAELMDQSVESEYLTERFEAVKSSYAAGEDISGQAEELKAEFKKIKDAIALLRTYHNKDLVSQMTPWLNELEPIVQTGQRIMDNFARIGGGQELGEEEYIQVKEEYEACRDALSFGGKWSGRREIGPFLLDVQSLISQKLLQEIGYTDEVRAITNYRNGSYLMSDASAITDGDERTAVRFEKAETEGKWFGVDLGSVTDIQSLEILIGADAEDPDTAPGYEVQISDNGEDWTAIETAKESNTIRNVNPESARFVRYYVTEGCGKNVQAREIFVNRTDRTVYTNVDAYKDLSVTETNNDISLPLMDELTLEPGCYIGIQFDSAKIIPGIAAQDDLTVEYSADGLKWETYEEKEITARFVRMVNDTEQEYKGALTQFTLSLTDAEIPQDMAVTEQGLTTWSGNKDQIIDGNRGTYHWTRDQKNGNGYTIDLQKPMMLYDVTVVMGDGDYMEAGVIEVSDDNSIWTEAGNITGSQVTTVYPEQEARYIRIRMTRDSSTWLKLAEVEVNMLASATEAPVLDNADAEAVIDRDLTTGFTCPAEAGSFTFQNYENPEAQILNLLKNADSTVKVEGMFDGQWKELEGTGTELITYDLEAAGKSSQIRVSWEADSGLVLYEMALESVQGEEQEKPSKTTLEYFLNKAKEHQANGDVDNCVESIKNLFAEAIAEGEAVMADENATYDEVMDATVKLMKAIQALDFKAADKTDLEMAVELAQGIDLTKYVEAGQAEFRQALAAAQEVLADGDAMQADADTAWNALVDAISNLRLKADKSTLEDLLNSVADLDLSRYTEESAAVFRTALANAQAVLSDETLTEDDQKTVDDAVQALSDAKDQLKLKDGSDSGNSGNGDGNTGDDSGNTGSGDNNNSGNAGSGKANAKADAPKTGDSGDWMLLCGIMLAAAGAVIVSRKKCF